MVMDWSYVGAVVITGLVIVFVGLILLIAAVMIIGKIFCLLGLSPKKSAENDEKSVPVPAEIPVEAPPVAEVIVPAAAEDDESEIIAVIAAAVAAMSAECGTPLKIKSIKPVSKVRTNAWARAAAFENTRYFL